MTAPHGAEHPGITPLSDAQVAAIAGRLDDATVDRLAHRLRNERHGYSEHERYENGQEHAELRHMVRLCWSEFHARLAALLADRAALAAEVARLRAGRESAVRSLLRCKASMMAPAMTEAVHDALAALAPLRHLRTQHPDEASTPTPAGHAGKHQEPPSCGPAATLDNETLLAVALEVAGRFAHSESKVQFDRLNECRDELRRRLALTPGPTTDDIPSGASMWLAELRERTTPTPGEPCGDCVRGVPRRNGFHYEWPDWTSEPGASWPCRTPGATVTTEETFEQTGFVVQQTDSCSPPEWLDLFTAESREVALQNAKDYFDPRYPTRAIERYTKTTISETVIE